MILSSKPAQRVWCLGDELRLEAVVAIARNVNRQLGELTLEGLLALAVAGIASLVGHRCMPVVAEVLGQFCVQRLLDQQLGQLLEQAVLADEVFGLLVVGQQAGQQFLGYFVLLGCHYAYGQAGSHLRWIGRLHKILHTLSSARFRAIASRAQGALPARRLGHRIGRTKMPVEDGFVASFQVRHFVQVE
jgi:hypothetical protein